jgi:cell division protein FtsI (penicillin-binding protein 3)
MDGARCCRIGRAEPIRELSRIRDPRPSGELRLSLDARIQALAYRELKAAVQENGAAGGSVVMLDSTTGDVLAMVNQPSFNPNNRIGLQPHNLRNRAIIDLVEPGSTVKPFTLAVALASGRYQPSTVIDTTPGYIQINGKVIRDVHNYGVIDLSHVLSKSSNVGTIKVALTLEETAGARPVRSGGTRAFHRQWLSW